jgi:hypothetical protein
MKRQWFKVPTRHLLLIAGTVWCIAGINIINLGVTSYFKEAGWLFWVLIIATTVIFTLFHVLIFSKMVSKHSDRIIESTEEHTHFWKFFDKRSYIIMACMMTGGIGLRASGLVPDWFIAFFYTGLGAALLVAGVSFFLRYFRGSKTHCPVMPSPKS